MKLKTLKFYARRTAALFLIVHGVTTWALMGYMLTRHVVHGVEMNEPGVYVSFWLLSMIEWMMGLYVWFLPRYSPEVMAMSKIVIDRENAARLVRT